MASTPHGNNVVSLDAHARARARLTPQECAAILAQCRELARTRLAAALGIALERAEEELFVLAEAARDPESQGLHLELRSQARARRPALEAEFGRELLAAWDARVKSGGAIDAVGEAPLSLELVDDEVLEHGLAVKAMAARLADACEGELGALTRRIGHLLGKPELAEADNPAGAHSLCAALEAAASAALEGGRKARLALLRALEPSLAGELRRLCQDLNAELVARQVLPEVKPAYRRNPAPPPRPAAPAGTAASDVHAALVELLGALAPPGAAGAGSLAPATRGFVRTLTTLQQPGATGASAAEAIANVIRDLKAAPQSAALPNLDAMTIDIVAMLFDFVFEDRQIPPAVKALLARLQIPVLKVALIDRAFFSSRAHPARQLLDRLARAAIGLDETSARGEATLAKLGHVVGRVLAEFDDELALFSELAAEMEAFLAGQDEAEEAIVARTARLVEERERREIARVLAEDEVDRRLAAREGVPEAVRAMLGDAWVRTLARAHVEHGEDSEPWRSLVDTMDELLWSVEPKARAEDRRRLVAGIPALVASLQSGLVRAGVDQAMRDAFLGALVDCHAEAVKAGLKGTAMPERLRARAEPPSAPAAPALERETVPAGDIQVEEIRLRSPRGAPPVRNVFTRTGIWTNVQRYTWVEFRREGVPPLRARLTWISPAKGVYLFTNSTASAAISVSPEALAEQMRRGEARIVDDAPLVDRAVDAVMASLRDRAA
ncbi:MAG: DUF1631 domain-containing protein [Burkholderiales bacterium]|nr:DUF1631 domain-containing protein [Burkholderiales bacterium]